MSGGMNLLAILQLLAVWPVIHWYVRRLADSSDSPVTVIALVTALACLIRDRKAETVSDRCYWPATVLMLVYAATYAVLPPLVRAMTAFASLGALWCSRSNFRRGCAGLLGLILLALPLQASMHFYLGYPLRRASGFLSMLMLRSNGLPVTLDGTLFRWGETLLQIDAPCSGANMLWMGIYLALAFSAIHRLGWKRTGLFTGMAITAVILANACRMTALFYLETHNFQGPEWLHAGVGIMAFLLSMVPVWWVFME